MQGGYTPALVKSLLSGRNNRCRTRILGVRSASALLDVLDAKNKHTISSASIDVLTPLRASLNSSRSKFTKNRRSENLDENDESDSEEEKQNEEGEEEEEEEQKTRSTTRTRSSQYRAHSPLNPFSSHTMTSARHHVERDLEGCTQKILRDLRDAFESFTSRLVRYNALPEMNPLSRMKIIFFAASIFVPRTSSSQSRFHTGTCRCRIERFSRTTRFDVSRIGF